jgi:hypothetical protein
MNQGLLNRAAGSIALTVVLLGLPACSDDKGVPQLVSPDEHGGRAATDDDFRLGKVVADGRTTVVELQIGAAGPLRERSRCWSIFTVDETETALPRARLVESSDARDPDDAKAFVLADNHGVVFDCAAVATSSPVALLRWERDLLPDGVAILCHGTAETVAASGPCIAYPGTEE